MVGKVTVVGFGWLGRFLGKLLLGKGWDVMGTKTTEAGVQSVKEADSLVNTYLLKFNPTVDASCNATLDTLFKNRDAIVITLPAYVSSPEDTFYETAVRSLVASIADRQQPQGASPPPRLIFTSSTSVYGNDEGEVTEETPTEGKTNAGKVLKTLEDWLLQSNPGGCSVDIVRLSGLIGQGRHPGRFFAPKPPSTASPTHHHRAAPLNEGQQLVNLVHLQDAAAAVAVLLENPTANSRVYNIAAPNHPPRGVFYPKMTSELGLEAPVFSETPGGSKGKVITADKITRELPFAYQYPDPLTIPMEAFQ